MQGFEADKGRWMLGGCLSVFAVPFFIAGVSIAGAGVRAFHRGDAAAPVLLGTGIVLTAFSAGFVALVWFSTRQLQAAARLRSLNPMQPWLWRDDWAARRVAEGRARPGAPLWIFALMWNAITIPMALLVARQSPPTPVAVLLFVFVAIGIALLAGATHSALQERKFGRSICAIDRMPVEPGQTFSGTIEHRDTQVPDAGYRLVLSCISQILTGGRRTRHVTTEVLWETEQRLSGALAAPGPMGMRIPFSFDIPADARSTDQSKPDDTVVWQLVVTAELPGIDYKATFELPVFATTGHVAAQHAVRQEEAARRELSPSSRVTITPLPSGGVELRVAPLRDLGAAMTFLFFAAIWFTAIGFMWRFGAPMFFAAIFSLFGLLILCMAIDFFAGTSIVSADRAGLRARHAVLGIATSKSIDAAQVESIAPKVGGHVGTRPYFDIEARLKDRSSRTLARYLVNRADAEAFAAKLWVALH